MTQQDNPHITHPPLNIVQVYMRSNLLHYLPHTAMIYLLGILSTLKYLLMNMSQNYNCSNNLMMFHHNYYRIYLVDILYMMMNQLKKNMFQEGNPCMMMSHL
jgi:hypothetical protein